uniref:Uncharacterized protein n=1 Tax=Hemiselmis tepida TaxID=464990 RepID=A0A7S0Z6R3_9CRYP|mmetsp:Transcript_7243/g.18491  ORF Transcript_7243/g.18491 Transcript_7243/m.18491 type:complete len:121 (+) Transcript_7243:1-363(+)
MIGSAAAFNAPMMVSRRDAMATGAAAAVVAPLIVPSGASALDKGLRAPIIELYDERDGCNAGAATIKAKQGAGEDGLCIKLRMAKIPLGGSKGAGSAHFDVRTNYNIAQIPPSYIQYFEE